MITFDIVGKLSAIKDTEKFHPYEERTFESGWQNSRIRFNVVSDTNRFMCEINGGKWIDDSRNTVKTSGRSENGEKPPMIEIPWAKRFDEEEINKVAGYKIYTFDPFTFEEKKTIDDDAKKKIKHFISTYDYSQYMKKVLDSGKYADTLFKISGTIDYQYSEKNNAYYQTLTVNKIFKVPDDAECSAEMRTTVFYSAESTENFPLFNVYAANYFSSVKKSMFVPLNLIIYSDGTEKGDTRAQRFKDLFSKFEDHEVKSVSLVCTMIDGSDRKQLTLDDLDEETRELVDLGLMDEAEALRSVGGSVRGEKKKEMRIKSLARSKGGVCVDTDYTLDILNAKPVAEVVNSTADSPVAEDDYSDLFSDDEI